MWPLDGVLSVAHVGGRHRQEIRVGAFKRSVSATAHTANKGVQFGFSSSTQQRALGQGDSPSEMFGPALARCPYDAAVSASGECASVALLPSMGAIPMRLAKCSEQIEKLSKSMGRVPGGG